MTRVPLGALLRQVQDSVLVGNPATETFVTLRLYGNGAVKRSIADGKTPKTFRGTRVRSGQFIYSRIDARNGAFGLIPDALDGAVVSKDFPIFDIDRSQVTPEYLRSVVAAPSFWSEISRLSFGATNRQRVSELELLRLQIPLPPLPEQRRIAAILDQVSRIQIIVGVAEQNLLDLRQSVFESRFGTASTSATDLVPLGSLVDITRPLTYGILMPGPDIDGGVPYVRVTDMRSGSIQVPQLRRTTRAISAEYSRSILRNGDLLMSIRGHVGRTAKVHLPLDGANITQDTVRIALSGLSPSYAEAWLAQPAVKAWLVRHTKGAAVKGINISDVQRLPIAVPPAAVQEAFERDIKVIEARAAIESARASKLDELFASLQHRAFNGEL